MNPVKKPEQKQLLTMAKLLLPVAAIVILTIFSAAEGQTTFDPGEVMKAIKEAEAYEASGMAGVPGWAGGDEKKHQKIKTRLAESDRMVSDHLSMRPDDTSALLLRFRVLRALMAIQPVRISMEAGRTEVDTEAGEQEQEQERILDRILELDPLNAEAYYWKARMAGMSGVSVSKVDGRPEFRGPDLDRAISFCRKAVELKPDEEDYREALAIYFTLAGRFREAEDVMKEVRKGNHPMYQLLKDRNRFPIPKTAVFDPRMTATLVELYGAAPSRPSYVGLRFFSYVYPGPFSEVEKIYREQWPDLTIFEQPKSGQGSEDGKRSLYTSFDWKRDELRPSKPSAVQKEKKPKSGLAIAFLQNSTSDLDETGAGRFPIQYEGIYTTIILENTR